MCLAALVLAACSSSEGGGDDGPTAGQIPDKAGMTVKGIVKDSAGNGIAGVVVSDGLEVTATDERGIYYLASDLARRNFVFVSVPADCEIPATQGCPRFYRKIDRKQAVNRADFTLTRRKTPADRHSLIVMADIQLAADNTSVDSYLGHGRSRCAENRAGASDGGLRSQLGRPGLERYVAFPEVPSGAGDAWLHDLQPAGQPRSRSGRVDRFARLAELRTLFRSGELLGEHRENPLSVPRQHPFRPCADRRRGVCDRSYGRNLPLDRSRFALRSGGQHARRLVPLPDSLSHEEHRSAQPPQFPAFPRCDKPL